MTENKYGIIKNNGKYQCPDGKVFRNEYDAEMHVKYGIVEIEDGPWHKYQCPDGKVFKERYDAEMYAWRLKYKDILSKPNTKKGDEPERGIVYPDFSEQEAQAFLALSDIKRPHRPSDFEINPMKSYMIPDLRGTFDDGKQRGW